MVDHRGAGRLIDRCVQLRRLRLHARYNVARAFLDARVQTIYGTTEIMKEIIGRSLGV